MHKIELEVGWNTFILCRISSEFALASLLSLPLPVESKETWQPEIPLGVQGDG